MPPAHAMGVAPIISVEIVYFIIILALCFWVYFRASEIYKLTKHKGIRLFRNTFLFFGLAFGARFLQLISVLSSEALFDIRGLRIGLLFLPLIMFFSTLALLHLTYSMTHKRFKLNGELIIYAVAFLATAVVFITGSLLILIILELLIFIVALVLSSFNYWTSKKGVLNSLHVIYTLLLLFWLLNLAPLQIVNQPLQLSVYLISIALFSMIPYRVERILHGTKRTS